MKLVVITKDTVAVYEGRKRIAIYTGMLTDKAWVEYLRLCKHPIEVD